MDKLLSYMSDVSLWSINEDLYDAESIGQEVYIITPRKRPTQIGQNMP